MKPLIFHSQIYFKLIGDILQRVASSGGREIVPVHHASDLFFLMVEYRRRDFAFREAHLLQLVRVVLFPCAGRVPHAVEPFDQSSALPLLLGFARQLDVRMLPLRYYPVQVGRLYVN